MSNPWIDMMRAVPVKRVLLDPTPGMMIQEVSKVARELAYWLDTLVEFNFNGVNIIVTKQMDEDEVVGQYNTKLKEGL